MGACKQSWRSARRENRSDAGALSALPIHHDPHGSVRWCRIGRGKRFRSHAACVGRNPFADGLAERPTALPLERRYIMSYFSPYCAEVQDYLRACEHFLAAAHIHNRQFSKEELQMVQSYAMD